MWRCSDIYTGVSCLYFRIFIILCDTTDQAAGLRRNVFVYADVPGGCDAVSYTHLEYNMSFINKYRDVGQNLEAERQQVADEWNRKLHDLVGDTDKLKHEITENMGKMKQLEQSVAAEKQSLLQKEAELSKM